MLPFEKINRRVLVKKEAETDPNKGCYPEKRKTEEIINFGLVNIDKPKGPTSHQVSDFVQRILKIPKSGHSGTLDPGVTGCLPIALDKSTRIVQLLLTAGKEYVAIMHLHQELGEAEIRKALSDFTGKIMQKPPIKSAVKRVMRQREIYYIEILEIKDKDVLIRVGCEAGTYIRKLIHDIGKRIGCGAHMAELRRTKAGPFREDTLCTLQDLADAFYYYKEEGNDKYLRKIILSVENAVQHIPKIWVFDSTIESLCHGSDLKVPGISKLNDGIKENDVVAILSLKGELIALGNSKMSSRDVLNKDKGIVVKTDKVFMAPGNYKAIS